jgi:endonuclease YncB( thermonuclease family)
MKILLWPAPALLVLAMLLAPMSTRPGYAETPRATPTSVAGSASVIDADTLDIHGQRIRLVGVDAPESGQKCLADGKFVRCGANAANALDAWINRNPVTCAIEGKDRYDRLLGQCSVRGQSVQEWLVASGHALAYRTYSTQYVPAELKARKARAGIWSGDFVAPWDWRQGLRLSGEKPTKAMLDGRFASNR